MGVQGCFCILLLFAVVNLGNSLECFNCSLTVTVRDGDPCKGQGTFVKCQDPAVCLSTTYSYEAPYPLSKQYIILKSCYQDMGGKECEIFSKNLENTIPSQTKIEFIEKCFACRENGCNKPVPQDSSTSAISDNILHYILLASLLCYLSTFL